MTMTTKISFISADFLQIQKTIKKIKHDPTRYYLSQVMRNKPKYKIGEKVFYQWCPAYKLNIGCIRKGTIESLSSQKGKYLYKFNGVEGIFWETDILTRYQSIKVHFIHFLESIKN